MRRLGLLVLLAPTLCSCSAPAEQKTPTALPGPLLPSPSEARPSAPVERDTPETRALALHASLLETALRGDVVAVQKLLSPSLRPRTAEVAGALIKHLRRFGPEAIGVAVKPAGVRVEGDGKRVSLQLQARHAPDEARYIVRTEAETGAAGARLISLHVGHADSKDDQLAISPDRLFSAVTSWIAHLPGGSVLTTRTSVAAPLGRFLLLRSSRGEMCALRFTGAPKPDSAAYEWVVWNAARRKPGQRGRGVAVGHRTPLADGTSRPHDDPVRCGPFRLVWSAPRNLHLTDPPRPRPDVEIALTDAATVDRLDPASQELRWLSYRWGELAYDQAAEGAALRALHEAGR
jgi:hypothetical protein